MIQKIAAEDLVLLDESGVTTSMYRLFTRAPCGRRSLSRAHAGRYERLTLLGAISLERLGALMTTPSSTDRAVFRTFVDEVLVATLRPGQVGVLDNLPAHKYPEAEAAVRVTGCQLLLPRYSPELIPIEPCWSKLKNELRSRAARIREALEVTVGEAAQIIAAQNGSGWFAHCGYQLALD